jgi:phosphate transport system permease protein
MAILQAPSRRLAWRKLNNKIMLCVTVLAALLAIVPLLLVIGYVIWQGMPALRFSTFTTGPTPMGTPGGGLRNGVVGTLLLLGIASCIGLPLGILGGIYMIEFGGKAASIVRFLADVLNSIPSIIIGIFVYVVVVLPTARMHPGHGFSAMAGGIALGILMIPTVMRTTEEILRLVPSGLRDGALALGSTKWRAMWGVVLPAARGGIITGVMLALARVAGETAPLLFTAFGNLNLNLKLDRPTDALPLDIFYNATAPYEYLHHLAQAGALILVLLILSMSITARRFTRSRFLIEK